MEKYNISSEKEDELVIENLPQDFEYITIDLTNESNGEVFALINDIIDEHCLILLTGEGKQKDRVDDIIPLLTETKPIHFVMYQSFRRIKHVWTPKERGLDSLQVDWVRKGSAALLCRKYDKFPPSIDKSSIKHLLPVPKSIRTGGRGRGRHYNKRNGHGDNNERVADETTPSHRGNYRHRCYQNNQRGNPRINSRNKDQFEANNKMSENAQNSSTNKNVCNNANEFDKQILDCNDRYKRNRKHSETNISNKQNSHKNVQNDRVETKSYSHKREINKSNLKNSVASK